MRKGIRTAGRAGLCVPRSPGHRLLQEAHRPPHTQTNVGSELPIRPFPEEEPLWTLLVFIYCEPSPASQGKYSLLADHWAWVG